MAAYLLRFDDICPTMNWRVWDRVETVLRSHDVRPIVAVVPDNHDEQLQVGAAAPAFWERVAGWQARGWTIGMHGYQHRYVTRDAGLLGLNPYSEFAGLPAEEQRKKLHAGAQRFRQYGVVPRVWVAPAHSFDATTVRLLREVNLEAISDGYFIWPHVDRSGVLWIPQQMSRLRRMPVGVWTTCYHTNNWSDRELARFTESVERFRREITRFEVIATTYRGRAAGWTDVVSSRSLFALSRAKYKAVRTVLPGVAA